LCNGGKIMYKKEELIKLAERCSEVLKDKY